MITHSSQPIAAGASRPSVGSRLLVSVRSVDEAMRALAGGADILDIKEPNLGSLGMADLSVIHDIVDLMQHRRAEIPLSAALGELADWIGRDDIPTIPSGVQFAKLGLSGMAERTDWPAEWRKVRDRFGSGRKRPLKWVAVAYADDMAACSPDWNEVLTATVGDGRSESEAGCAGLLIDTFAKTGKSLLDYLTVEALREIAQRCHVAGMFLAVAGSLTITAIRGLRGANADIVAIRSAACRNGNRRDGIDETLVASIRQVVRGEANAG